MNNQLSDVTILLVSEDNVFREIYHEELSFVGADIVEACSVCPTHEGFLADLSVVVVDFRSPNDALLNSLATIKRKRRPLIIVIVESNMLLPTKLKYGEVGKIFEMPVNLDNLIHYISSNASKRSKRKYQRFSTKTKIQTQELFLDSENNVFDVNDIGFGGCYVVKENANFDIGRIFKFNIFDEDRSLLDIQGLGSIRWFTSKKILGKPAGFGVEFVGDQSDFNLTQYLSILYECTT